MKDSSRDRKNLPKDQEIRWRAALGAVAVGALFYGFSIVLSLAPSLAESMLGNGKGIVLSRALSSLFGWVPFSVAEVLFGAYVSWIVILTVRGVLCVRRNERGALNLVYGGARRVARDGGVMVALFFILWGFNYSRAPVADRSDWPDWREPAVEELTALTQAAVLGANEAYLTLNGSPDLGTPTPMALDMRALESAIREGSRLALPFLPSGQTGGRGMPRTRVKRPWTTGVIARLGMSGVFVPFTAEPHVVRGLPAASAVQTFAHEHAHSWGFANEAEASYAGYLANALAPDPLPRYGAALFAANQLLRALARIDRDRAVTLRARFGPGIDRDLRATADFWRPYAGIGQTLGSAVNDRYLRANRVAGGVDSYRRSAWLLVEFARQNGGLKPQPSLSSR